MKEIIKEKMMKASVVAIPAVTLLTSAGVHAAEGDTGTAQSISSSLTAIASDITSTIGAIAPIAMGIAGLFLAWRYGMKFFKSVSK